MADRPWNASAWTDAEGAQCGLLSREYGAPLFVKVSRLFRLDPESDALFVRQCIERTAPSLVPVSLWTISQTDWADLIAMPVDSSSKFPRGVKSLLGEDPSGELDFCGDIAVFRSSASGETKLGSDSSRGWIAAARGTNLVFETVANAATGDYPDGGSVVEVYSNQGLGYSEIETLSPELDLEPGTVLENVLRIELSATTAPLAPCPLAAAVRVLAAP